MTGRVRHFSRWLLPVLLCCWTSTVQASELTVLDDFQRTVSLAKPADRIISLAPHNTENLFSAGAGDKVVGVVEYSDYPEQAKTLPILGSYIQFNLEAILNLQPDLVVAWRSGNNAEALDQIEQFGIPVYYSEPRSFQDIVDNISELAMLAGTTDKMEPGLESISERIQNLRETYQDKHSIKVFYQVWTDPLMTLNGEHFISRVLELCGAENLFASLSIIAPQVNIESVIEANPDVIVSGMVNNLEPDMSLWTPWTSVDAVKHDRFLFVDSDVMHRHTYRMLNGIETVCKGLDKFRASL